MSGRNNDYPNSAKSLVTALHQKMYERLHRPLAELAREKILEGFPANIVFGVIIDLDDHVWRKHFDMGPNAPPPGTPNSPGTVKRAFCCVVGRSQIQHIIDMLPAFEDFFAESLPPGYIPALVLAAGMATPYTVHWGAELELEWE